MIKFKQNNVSINSFVEFIKNKKNLVFSSFKIYHEILFNKVFNLSIKKTLSLKY